MAKAGAKRKGANGYKLPDPLPKGEILEDLAKKKWKLGPSIGQGGFGEIYSAQEAGSSGSQYPYVIKIEPHANGPLFVERKFYLTNAKPADVEAFKKEKGLKTFGMPTYLGSGTHEYKSEKYRFLVMDKFGTDLWKIFLENNRVLPATTVFKLAVQILDVLEYIHKCGYIHADIKGANVLLGISKDTANKQVYLVDFGLATRFTEETEYKPNPKKAHDGTIEYLSRDSHQGVQTRRGDLEILAYNLIQWLGCKLPWENLKTPKDVQQSKEQYMKDIPKFIRTCFEKRSPSGPIVDFLNYIISLEFNAVPDYKQVRKIFLSGLDSGDSLTKPFQFTAPKKSQVTPTKRKNNKRLAGSPKRKIAKKKNVEEDEEEAPEEEKENFDNDNDIDVDDVEVSKKPKKSQKKKPVAKKEETYDFDENLDDLPEVSKTKPKKATQKQKMVTKKDLDENSDNDNDVDMDDIPEVPAASKSKVKKTPQKKKKEKVVKKESDDEIVEEVVRESRGRARKPVNYKEDSDNESKKAPRARKAVKTSPKKIHVTGDDLHGYNSAMKDVLMKKERKEKGKKNGVPQDMDTEEKINGKDNMEGFTEEMKKIAAKSNSNKKEAPDRKPVPSTSKDVEDEADTDDSMEEFGKILESVNKGIEDNVNSDDSMDGFNDEMKEVAGKKKSKVRQGKTVPSSSKDVESDINSDEGMDGFNDEMKEVAGKKKSKVRQGKTVPSSSKDVEDDINSDDGMDGFNDEMKEIVEKKIKKGKTDKSKLPPTNKDVEDEDDSNDDGERFTDEMKEIALKKIVKKNKKRKADNEPGPSTSKTKNTQRSRKLYNQQVPELYDSD